MVNKRVRNDSGAQQTEHSDSNSNDYIENQEFLVEIKKYLKLCKKNKGQRAPVPETLAVYFIQIAENLANRFSYFKYTFKEDMISEAVEVCLKGAWRFDPTKISVRNPKKGVNAFGYFTQIVKWSFWRKIQEEHEEIYIRYKMFLDSELVDNEEYLTATQKDDILADQKREFVQKFEDKLQKKKDKAKEKRCKEIVSMFDGCLSE